MGDYHIHLHPHGPPTGDGPAPGVYPSGHIEAYVDKARSRGVEELCFTEHLYRCVESAPVLGRFWEGEPKRDLAKQTQAFIEEDRTLSLESYVEAVVSAKNRGLPVLLGLEVDFFPETIDAVLDLLEPYPWDILVGAVHWIGGWSLDHPEAVHEYMRRGVRQAYEDYFALVTRLAESGAVDVLAHVDLAKVFGHRPDEPPLDLYEPVVEGAASTGTAVELNTSGIDGLAGELYPSGSFLEMFRAAGVGITLASDAHRPHDVGQHFDMAVGAARAAGYVTRLQFRQRFATKVPL
ncbi:MAG TPA: histidinol-phosphatase HisJ family protein [Acidimicrobiia bacterium]